MKMREEVLVDTKAIWNLNADALETELSKFLFVRATLGHQGINKIP